MKFTYEAYERFLYELRECGYKDCLYTNWENQKKAVILRHDIDFSIEAACCLSEIEKAAGVRATYFVMLNTNFYNAAAAKSREQINRIRENGGVIGLHFDEAFCWERDIAQAVLKEKKILEAILEIPIQCVSMHRPTSRMLEGDLKIEGMINAYDAVYTKKFRYLSDSRRVWREDVDEIVRAGMDARLHILTHAFWYRQRELTAKETLQDFIRQGKYRLYHALEQNIRNMSELLALSEIDRL